MNSTPRLTDLRTGACATVAGLRADGSHALTLATQRLAELGFLPGESVRLVQRGPGGREPLAVVVGESMFALRWLEAQCVEISHP